MGGGGERKKINVGKTKPKIIPIKRGKTQKHVRRGKIGGRRINSLEPATKIETISRGKLK